MTENSLSSTVRRLWWVVITIAVLTSAISVSLWRELVILQRSMRTLDMRSTGRPWKETEPLLEGSAKKTASFQFEGRTWTALFFPSGANGEDILFVVDEGGVVRGTSTGEHLGSGPLFQRAFDSLE